MQIAPTQLNLEIVPEARFDLIDVTKHIYKTHGDLLNRYKKSLYCSFHTTAGYLEESICEKFHHPQQVHPFISTFRKLFPPEANYRHDQLQLRTELSEEQRRIEPKNADSHLIFISSGMKNCVTYNNKPWRPVYFIDLDGVNGSAYRRRKTTVLAFNKEEAVHQTNMPIPVSRHPIDSINLKDTRQEFFEQIRELVDRFDVQHGKIDIELADDEKHAGLTVNEFETLLMKHDLAEVLHNPLKYMAIKGRHALAEPFLIPGKTLDYAKYDLVQLFNKVMDTMGVSETIVERLLSIFLRVPASHFLSVKRHISLFVCENRFNGNGNIVFGRYQSPILVQWKRAKGETRYVKIKISKFG
ncbi:hypothetical protein GWO43_17920 [candidate division KSB1 bacterium]|nr:hypothetical protein [candidate division KSB1 bacterium]NIR69928.1 hypothetical protein [candidate division KSB1 bacterium]NIS25837.1 hypothetical protein [candidate division KSB1 bacterium]NIT72712.1 hypothetical protein [candidate division KSB1 bacterium]NIU26526.1 hypothetical protein [candidate division KSB1 bacterium]